jgi:hypothetical protein
MNDLEGALKLSIQGAALLVALTTGCASAGHLAEYDFRDRSVAVVTIAPAHPDVFTQGDLWLGDRSFAEAVVRVVAGIAREEEAQRARIRLDSAVAVVDVSKRMSARVLDQGARQLRARAVDSVPRSDFEIELRVRRYGIEAHNWDDQARFMIDADVLLLDGESGRVIWKANVDEDTRVSSSLLGWALPGALGGFVTADQLASLSVPEMTRALEGLADFCADRMIEKLRAGLEKARS